MNDIIVNRDCYINYFFVAYDAKIKLYSNGDLVLKNYSKPLFHKKELEIHNAIIDSIDDIENSNDKKGRVAAADVTSEIRKDSLIRSRDLITDYACENEEDFCSFLTLTFKEEIKDITEANKSFIKWRKQISKEFKKEFGYEFKYLGVPEFQKNGRVHYHLLTNIPCNSFLLPKRPKKRLFNPSQKKTTVLEYYDIPYWKFGFSSAFDFLNECDEKFNIALYITKYLYKDFDDRLYGHTRVLKSNNLKKPNIYLLNQNSITYKNALQYITEKTNEKKYDIRKVFQTLPTKDNTYIIPSISLSFKSQCDNNIISDILKDELEF